MGFTDRKLEIAILALSITMVGGLGYVLKTPVQGAILAGADIVYEMPRIKKSFLAALFDLEGREVERIYTNPFAKKAAAEKKKAEEAKKAEAVAAKAAAKKTVAKKSENAKKPTVDIKTVDANPAKQWGDDGFFGNSAPRANQVVNAGGKSVSDDNKEKSEMTADQWRSLLRAQPTAENVAKLITAFSRQEVDAETYYTIVADLYKNNSPDVQALGLKASQAFYSARSFMVTTQYYDQFTPEIQTEAHSYLMTYAVSGRLGILASVLKSSNVDAITMATEVIVAGYHNSGTNTGTDPRTSRGDVVKNSTSSYTQFIPIFQELQGHQDSSVASLASSALNQLQQSSVAAL